MNRMRQFIIKNEIPIALLIIAVGAFFRFFLIDSMPAGLNQDEASAGYDAWAVLHYGIDRNGNSYPVLFEAWGSGQNILYSMIDIPFIAVLGLNKLALRLPAAIIGTLTLPVFWRLSRKFKGIITGLFALLILALCPWHIMANRWALESNILPFFLLLGTYFAVLSIKKPKMLCLSGVAFALSLYAYGTAFVFVPFFVIGTGIYLIRIKKLKLRSFLIAASVFLVMAFPIILCNMINIFGWDEIRLFGIITLPKLVVTRQSGTMSFSVNNFIEFISLLINQQDESIVNVIDHLMFFYFSIPFSVLGVFFTLKNYKKSRYKILSGDFIMLWWLIVALANSFFIHINVNRMNMAYLPVIYYSAAGIGGAIQFLYIHKKMIGKYAVTFVSIGLILWSFVDAALQYTSNKQYWYSVKFSDGFEDALSYAESLDHDIICLSEFKSNMLYIRVLFYQQISPEDFHNQAEYFYPDAEFRVPKGFLNYRFNYPYHGLFSYDEKDEDTIYILENNCTNGYVILKQFNNFSVCKYEKG